MWDDPERYVKAHPYNMDLRHVRMIHNALLLERRRRVLEIGAFIGYSTCALLDAAARGAVEEAHVCDVQVTSQLRTVFEHYPTVKPVVHARSSVDLLKEDPGWDLVVIDGDHSMETVTREAELLLAADVPEVFAHDTGNMAGPMALKRMFAADGRYRCWEDAAPRVGERTERGLFYARRR